MRPASPSSVAEKKSVCRWRGHWATIRSTGGLEAHVEHPVGLVEHENADVLEREGAAREQILQATGRRDDDVRLGRLARLLLEAYAAVDGLDLEGTGVRDPVGRLDDLRGELARGGEDQRRGAAIGRLDAIDDRDHEGERLARSGR